MTVKIDIVAIHNSIKSIDETISNGTIEEVIAFAKQYNIHQESTNEYYLSNVQKIKVRLAENNINESEIVADIILTTGATR